MKIAVCQLEIKRGEKEDNKERAVAFLKAAALHGADLILFPEMSLTGFTPNEADMKEENQESITEFSGYASQYKIAVGLGWVKAAGSQLENRYTFLGKDGKILADYAKIHPFSGEKNFRAGEEVITFTLEGRKCGIFICYDLRFPEIFRHVADKAEIIFIPANWPECRREHWDCFLMARALEEQVYMVGINCYGYQHRTYYSGDSQVVSPRGAQMESIHDKEGMFFYEIPDDVAKAREEFPVLQDRKKELYYNLMIKEKEENKNAL